MKNLGLIFRWRVVGYAVLVSLIVIPLASEFPKEMKLGLCLASVVVLVGRVVSTIRFRKALARVDLDKIERDLQELENNHKKDKDDA